jgi:hypothetical protein
VTISNTDVTTEHENKSSRNIGYFEGIYVCENLTFHLQTEKDVKFLSEMHKFLENGHYYL